MDWLPLVRKRRNTAAQGAELKFHDLLFNITVSIIIHTTH